MASERLPNAVNSILETPPGEDVVPPEVEPDASARWRRGRGRGRRAQRGAGERDRSRGRAGRAAPQHRRLVRQPRSPQPEPALPSARPHHRSSSRKSRTPKSSSSCSASTTSPPACAATPSRCSCSRARSRPVSGRRRCPVGDVLRAALGEVEQYARVRLQPIDETTVIGKAVADVSHIVAELVENGLTFSPPDSDGERLRTPQRRGLRRSRSSTPASECRKRTSHERTVRLSAKESFTVAPSRYLGHYVVAQLALRHQIQVDARTVGGRRCDGDDRAALHVARRRHGRPDQRDARSRRVLVRRLRPRRRRTGRRRARRGPADR